MRLSWGARLASLTVLVLLASGCNFITRASVDRAGGDTNGFSEGSSISADGRYVAFDSTASDLVANDNNDASDVFVRDLRKRTTTRVSVDTAGGDANGASIRPAISADGRYVAFDSYASDLVAGDGTSGPNGDDIFVRDLLTGTTTRVSVNTSGGDPNGPSGSASISADGRYVAFESYASDLVAGDGTSGFDGNDIFRRDLLSGTTTRVSVNTTGGDPDGPSFTFFANAISADGQRVAFTSNADNLVAADNNANSDVFVRDLGANTTTQISVSLARGAADGESEQGEISSSGRYVAFGSNASDLVPGGGNCTETEEGPYCLSDVYVRDTEAGTTTKASTDMDDGNANASSQDGSVSADGRYVAFSSLASDLVPKDDNGAIDVFVRDLRTGRTKRISVDQNGHDATGGQSYWPSITPDARFVVFTSQADNLVGNDDNGVEDVYVRRLR